jgi:hypothetical protein
MHLHTVYMEYSECLPILVNPLAERTCFSQVGEHLGADLHLVSLEQFSAVSNRLEQRSPGLSCF